jgi:hypothetical protein
MGKASDLAAALTRVPLSAAESAARREDARVREHLTTTLDGAVVDRKTSSETPKPVRPPEHRIWD